MSGWHPYRDKSLTRNEPSNNNAQRLRQLADAEWAAALSESLPQRRQQRERSAMRWDEMAVAAEAFVIKADVNARAREPRSG